MKKLYIAFIALVLCTGLILFHKYRRSSQKMLSTEQLSRAEKDRIIERALALELPAPSTVISQEALQFRAEAMKNVMAANYEKAIDGVLSGLQKIPDSFTLQAALAALVGDTSEITDEPLKSKMLQKAKTMFEVLLKEAEAQPREAFYTFQNEYDYRNALYREQYENGIKCVAHFWGTAQWDPMGIKGYYYQGVGAANYAKVLVEQGDKPLALEYAQKAIVAWAQYFSYENDYYNAYVHYAFALGILGYHEEMMRALQRSSGMIGKDLNYFEFKEVTDFIDRMNRAQ